MLVLALLQGSSFTVSLAIRTPLAGTAAGTAFNALWMLMYLVSAAGLFMNSGLNWATWMVRYRLPLTIIVSGVCFSSLWSMDAALTLELAVHLLVTTLVAWY